MKRAAFLVVFIIAQICFIVLLIYKQSKIIEISYQKQRNEKTKDRLFQKKSDLIQKLYEIKNHSKIKQYAAEELKMKKVGLSQIKKISDE